MDDQNSRLFLDKIPDYLQQRQKSSRQDMQCQVGSAQKEVGPKKWLWIVLMKNKMRLDAEEKEGRKRDAGLDHSSPG